MTAASPAKNKQSISLLSRKNLNKKSDIYINIKQEVNWSLIELNGFELWQ